MYLLVSSRKMMIFNFLLALSTFLVFVHAKIEQIHLSLGTNETEMVVTWTDPSREAKTAKVIYGQSYSDMTAKVDGLRQEFVDDRIKFYTFRALLINLKPGTDYYYQIITETQEKSGRLKFHTLPEGFNWLPRFAIYGDLGFENGTSLPHLTGTVRRNLFDVIFHVGNIAIDLHSSKGKIGNKFMRSIETVAVRLPYMTCPGNHEHHDNFSNYDARFSMIGDRNNPNYNAPIDERINNHFHSMNIGPAHIIMFSTEFYYFTEYGWEQIERQYQWLRDDLKLAQQNRHERPWIIVMGHRPFYCLDKEDDSCNPKTLDRDDIRQGIRMYGKGNRKFGLEELFYKYRVDLQFYGHEHFYARSLPLYKFKIRQGFQNNGTNAYGIYNNSQAPIHIITGLAGDKERQTTTINLNNWVAKYFFDHGYTRLVFEDKYKIHIQQVSVDKHGRILDQFNVLKNPVIQPVTNPPIIPDRSDEKPDDYPEEPDYPEVPDDPNDGIFNWIYNFIQLVFSLEWIIHLFNPFNWFRWLEILFLYLRNFKLLQYDNIPRHYCYSYMSNCHEDHINY